MKEDSHRLHAINSLQDVVLFVIFVLHILVKYPPEYMDMYIDCFTDDIFFFLEAIHPAG